MLKDMREKKGISQSQLSKASGINVRTIQHYEQGSKDINGAKLNTLISLAEALDCKIYDILSNEELIIKTKKHLTE